jgi:hypothetical protein
MAIFLSFFIPYLLYAVQPVRERLPEFGLGVGSGDHADMAGLRADDRAVF